MPCARETPGRRCARSASVAAGDVGERAADKSTPPTCRLSDLEARPTRSGCRGSRKRPNSRGEPAGIPLRVAR
eukprot:12382284-Alexandrium_andersonii.AAC.1